MNRRHISLLILALGCISILPGCGSDDGSADAHTVTVADTASTPFPSVEPGADRLSSDDSGASAVMGASEIPYPVYPNGSKYRIGGENGLKIVLFETTDSFEEVDEFYQNASQKRGMPRLTAMNDYVRYSSGADDRDPWATYRPGIVIHEFNDDQERRAIGAGKKAQTNIIMSY
ncbi:MAG: hypothetical protein HKN42_11190 [Granulosicoccus sp.]|nr:hypothetical protein [Granulosicoccus sp.]